MKHHLTIAAIFKHENPYLREWIEYHRMVGFDHFYLYDNDGGEEALGILEPYIAEDLVTHHPWMQFDGTRHDGPTYLFFQDKNHRAFAHAASTYRDQFDWIMKIDIDEFLVPLEGDHLRPIIDRYAANSRIRGMRIPRIDFGHSGHMEKPKGLVIESYTLRESAVSDHKDMARGEFLSSNKYSSSAHSWNYRLLKRGRTLTEGEIGDMRIHHYYTKSRDECLQRQNNMRTRPITEEEFFEQNRHLNTTSDPEILRFVPELRTRLGLEDPEL